MKYTYRERVIEFPREWKPVDIALHNVHIRQVTGRGVCRFHTIAKIDADTNPDSVRTYGVMSMPTLLVFRKGEVVGSMVGAKPKASLRKAIDDLI